MQSSLMQSLHDGTKLTGDHITDLFTVLLIIVPPLVNLLLNYLNLQRSRGNSRKLTRLERALFDEVEKQAKDRKKVD